MIITHAHADHVGGAKLLQDRIPGVRIVMGGPDWDSIEKSVNGYPQGKPKRDIVAGDGQKITVGNNTVTLVLTPGHTPGTLSMLFTVRDNGKPLSTFTSSMASPFRRETDALYSICLAGLKAPIGGSLYVGQTTF